MEKITIKANNKDYLVDVADTEELRKKGLQNRENLSESRGMLFVFDECEEVSMWMVDTLIPLDIIFIAENGLVINTYEGVPGDESLLTEDDIKYVLEVNCDSGIYSGDVIDLGELEEIYDESDEDFDKEAFNIKISLNINSEGEVVETEGDELEEEEENDPLLIIDEKGRIQMELKGGERIFSRKNTKTLISMAKRAWLSKEDKHYKALGKKVFNYLDIQNNKEDDFVEIKKPD